MRKQATKRIANQLIRINCYFRMHVDLFEVIFNWGNISNHIYISRKQDIILKIRFHLSPRALYWGQRRVLLKSSRVDTTPSLIDGTTVFKMRP